MSAVQDEARLVVEACQGSITAFEVLVTRYEPRIRRIIYGLTHAVQLTQDLCQETFLSAYRALPRMKETDLHFAPWLYRIAVNQVRSEWRRRKHVTLVPITSPCTYGDEPAHDMSEDELVSDEHFEEQVVERDLVRRVLGRLPEEAVTCLLLDAEGFSYKEIAAIQQETVSAIRSRLSRARQLFQRIYSGLDKDAL